MRRSARRSEQGQALILALALLGLLSGFSVSILRLASSSADRASSVRETAYRDALRGAGALMARQVVADGLGCNTSSPMTAKFNSELISVTVPQAKEATPQDCALLKGDVDGGDGTVPGDYFVCATVSGSGASETATVKVTASQPNGPGTDLNIDIVRFTFGSTSPC